MNYCLNSWSAAQPASSGRNHYILARNRNVFSVKTASHSSTSQVNGNVASSRLASIIPRHGGHGSITYPDVSATRVFIWRGTLWIHAFIHSFLGGRLRSWCGSRSGQTRWKTARPRVSTALMTRTGASPGCAFVVELNSSDPPIWSSPWFYFGFKVNTHCFS